MYHSAHAIAQRTVHIYHSTTSHSSGPVSWPVMLIVLGFLIVGFIVAGLIRR